MQERLLGCDAPGRLVLEHLEQQVEASIIDQVCRYQVAQIDLLVIRPVDRLELLVLGQTGPDFGCGFAKDSEDLQQLRVLVVPLEQRVVHRQLSEDASH